MKDNSHDRKKMLTPDNPLYRGWIEKFTTDELVRDTGTGDITTKALFGKKTKGNLLLTKARIVAKASGIVAGIQEVEYFLVKGAPRVRPGIGPLRVKFFKKDGEKVRRGEVIIELAGDLRDILRVERVVLNLVARMSGVATHAADIVDKVRSVSPSASLTPTRKTLWGLLDKRACILAGAGTHRLGLYDAILIKDNHLVALRGDIEKALALGYAYATSHRNALGTPAFIEIEVNSISQALRVAQWVLKFQPLKKVSRYSFIIMLDNFTPSRIGRTLDLLKKKKLRDAVALEVSGGINAKNISAFVSTGVDIVSSGALTHSAPSFDVSLEILH